MQFHGLWILLLVGLASTSTVIGSSDEVDSPGTTADNQDARSATPAANNFGSSGDAGQLALDTDLCLDSGPNRTCVLPQNCSTTHIETLRCPVDGTVCCDDGSVRGGRSLEDEEEKKEVDSALHSGLEDLEKRDKLEKVLITKNLFVKPFTAEGMHNEYLKSDDKALDDERNSFVVVQAIKYLSYKMPEADEVSDAVKRYMDGDHGSFDHLFSQFDVPFGDKMPEQDIMARYGGGQAIEPGTTNMTAEGNSGDFLDGERESQTRRGRGSNYYNSGDYSKGCRPVKYRSIDGTCNNLKYPDWGRSFYAYNRLLSAAYSDGVSLPKKAKDGSYLPSARLLSTSICVDSSHVEYKNSLMVMQWGQFIDHEMSFTPVYKARGTHGILCCAKEIYENANLLHPECYPIPIPEDDYFYKSHQYSHQSRCMECVRSLAAPASYGDKYKGKRQQLNQVTSYIDASVVYGSTPKEAASLRTYKYGQLKSIMKNGKEYVPVEIEPFCNDPALCYRVRTGDSRANQHPWLTVIHNLFLRVHNQYAYQLYRINPHWDDEYLYQETRRIVGAILQHITYNEFLPALFGNEFLSQYGLNIKRYGYNNDYDDYLNPTSLNEFTSAAFRVGHSLIYGSIEFRSREYGNGKLGPLRDHYFVPQEILQEGELDKYILSLMTQSPERADIHVTKEVTNYLFKNKNVTHGLDLISLNIQRGRDHGLPGYNEYRKLCGYKKAYSFEDLYPSIDQDVIEKLKYLYKHVDDIDLYIGGIAEKHNRYSLLGPTFSCIIANQFRRVKRGDRFWYELEGQLSTFTPGQLQEIRKITLGTIICLYSDKIEYVQKWVFKSQYKYNLPVHCGDAKVHRRINLNKWKQQRSGKGYGRYDYPGSYVDPKTSYDSASYAGSDYGKSEPVYVNTGSYNGPASGYDKSYGGAIPAYDSVAYTDTDYSSYQKPPINIPHVDSLASKIGYDSSSYAQNYGKGPSYGPTYGPESSANYGPEPYASETAYSGPTYETKTYEEGDSYSPTYESKGYEAGSPAYDSTGYDAGSPAYEAKGYEAGSPAYEAKGYEAGSPAYDSKGYEAGSPAYEAKGYEAGSPAYDSKGYDAGSPAYETTSYGGAGEYGLADSYGDSSYKPSYGGDTYGGASYTPGYEGKTYNGPSYNPPYGGASYNPGYDGKNYDGPSYNPPYGGASYTPGYEGKTYDGPSYNPPYGAASYTPGYEGKTYDGPSYNPPYGGASYTPGYEGKTYGGPAYNPPYGGDSYTPGYDGKNYDGPAYNPPYGGASYTPGYGGQNYDGPSYNPGYGEQNYDGPSYNPGYGGQNYGGPGYNPGYDGDKGYHDSSYSGYKPNYEGDTYEKRLVGRSYDPYSYYNPYGADKSAYASASKSAYDSGYKADSDYDAARGSAYASGAKAYNKDSDYYAANKDAYKNKDYYAKSAEKDYYDYGGKYYDNAYVANRKYYEATYGSKKAYEDSVYSSGKVKAQYAKGDHKEYDAAAAHDKSAYDASAYDSKAKADSYEKATAADSYDKESDSDYASASKSSYDSDASYADKTSYEKPVYVEPAYESAAPYKSSYDTSYPASEYGYGKEQDYKGEEYPSKGYSEDYGYSKKPGYDDKYNYGEAGYSKYGDKDYTSYGDKEYTSYGDKDSSYGDKYGSDYGKEYGYDKPGYGYDKPGYGYDKPSYGYDKKGYGYDKPGYGYDKPSYGYDKPGYGYEKPGYGYDDKPGYGYDNKPGYGYDKPGYGYDKSGSGYDDKPEYYEDKSAYTDNDKYGYKQEYPDSYKYESKPGYTDYSAPKYESSKYQSHSGYKPYKPGYKEYGYGGDGYGDRYARSHLNLTMDGESLNKTEDWSLDNENDTISLPTELDDFKDVMNYNETEESNSGDKEEEKDDDEVGKRKQRDYGGHDVNKGYEHRVPRAYGYRGSRPYGQYGYKEPGYNKYSGYKPPHYGYYKQPKYYQPPPSYASSAYASKSDYDNNYKAASDHDAAKSSAYGAETSYYDKEADKYGSHKDDYSASDYAMRKAADDYYDKDASYGNKKYGARRKYYESSYGKKKAYEDSVYSKSDYEDKHAEKDHSMYDKEATDAAASYDASSYGAQYHADDYEKKKAADYYDKEKDDYYAAADKSSYAAKADTYEKEKYPAPEPYESY